MTCFFSTDKKGREIEEGEEEAENRDTGSQDDVSVPVKDASSPRGELIGSVSTVDADGGSVMQSDGGEGSVVMLGSTTQTAEESWKEEEEAISPFIKTAAYLLDVHAIKVGFLLCWPLNLFHFKPLLHLVHRDVPGPRAYQSICFRRRRRRRRESVSSI